MVPFIICYVGREMECNRALILRRNEYILLQKRIPRRRKLLCVLKRWHLVWQHGVVTELDAKQSRDVFFFHFVAELRLAANDIKKSTHAITSQLDRTMARDKGNNESKEVYEKTKSSEPSSNCSKKAIEIFLTGLRLGIELVLGAREHFAEAVSHDQQLAFEQKLPSLCHRAELL